MGKILQLSVKGQVLAREKTLFIIEGTKNYLKVKFNFYDSDWDGLVKTALFMDGNGKIYPRLVDDTGLSDCPAEWIEAGKKRIGLLGSDGTINITTNSIYLDIGSKGYTGEAVDEEEAESYFDQIMSAFVEAKKFVASEADRAEESEKTAKSWAVGGSGIRDMEDEDNAKFYATQAETAKTNAENFASDAEQSKTAAEEASNTANASAEEAKKSAENAVASETNSASSASEAKQSAQDASSSAVSAKNHAEKTAEDAETVAQNKAEIKTLKADAETASTSAGNSAALAASAVETVAESAKNASASETAAAESATSALGSAESARESVQKSSENATAAAESATNASESEKNAKESEQATEEAKNEAVAAKTDAESARTDIQDSVDGVAQETTAAQVLAVMQELLPLVKAIAESESQAGSLNGFGLELGGNDSVVISYSNPDTGELLDVCTFPTDTTAQKISDILVGIKESIKNIAEEGEADES